MPLVLEGGSIDVNGSGTLITTEECLLDQKIQPRNPGITKSELEKLFRKVPRHYQCHLVESGH